MERNTKFLLGKRAIELFLKEAARLAGGKKTRLIIAGGLAVSVYGMPERKTLDIDAEIISEDSELIEKINKRFKELKVPVDISDNISRWGMVDIPPSYRKRARPYKKLGSVELCLLSPIDLIVSKLRIFRDIDIEDILFLAKKFNITFNEIKKEADLAISISPRSTELLFFKKNLQYLRKIIASK